MADELSDMKATLALHLLRKEELFRKRFVFVMEVDDGVVLISPKTKGDMAKAAELLRTSGAITTHWEKTLKSAIRMKENKAIYVSVGKKDSDGNRKITIIGIREERDYIAFWDDIDRLRTIVLSATTKE